MEEDVKRQMQKELEKKTGIPMPATPDLGAMQANVQIGA
jgi:hypothetical protein